MHHVTSSLFPFDGGPHIQSAMNGAYRRLCVTALHSRALRTIAVILLAVAWSGSASRASAQSGTDLPVTFRHEPLTREANKLYPSSVAQVEAAVGVLRIAGIMQSGSACDTLVAAGSLAGDTITIRLVAHREDVACASNTRPGWFAYRAAIDSVPSAVYLVRLEQHPRGGWPLHEEVVREFEVEFVSTPRR